jgi:hypothetical protein
MDNNSYVAPEKATRKDNTKKILAVWAGLATIVAIIGCVFSISTITDKGNNKNAGEVKECAEEEEPEPEEITEEQALALAKKDDIVRKALISGGIPTVGLGIVEEDEVRHLENEAGETLSVSTVSRADFMKAIYSVYDPEFFETKVDGTGYYTSYKENDIQYVATHAGAGATSLPIDICSVEKTSTYIFNVKASVGNDCKGNRMTPEGVEYDGGTTTKEYTISIGFYNDRPVITDSTRSGF